MKLSNTLMINEALLPSAKKAFTLAEVLITLSILGVVAALTIPALVNRNSDIAAQTKLKKAIAAYETSVAVYMAESGKANASKMMGDACANAESYFKVVAKGKTACDFTTADGAAWHFDPSTGNATVADSDKAPRYAVALWNSNGRVNDDDETNGAPNYPTATTTDEETGESTTAYSLMTTTYTGSATGATAVAPANGRAITTAALFMKGTYACTAAPTLSEKKVTCTKKS